MSAQQEAKSKANVERVNENVKAMQAEGKETERGAKRRSCAHLLLDQRNQLRERERVTERERAHCVCATLSQTTIKKTIRKKAKRQQQQQQQDSQLGARTCSLLLSKPRIIIIIVIIIAMKIIIN